MVAPERDVFATLIKRATYRYQSTPPMGKTQVFHRDMRTLPDMTGRIKGNIRCCITSPPYFDVTNFEEDQWLRLWMLGGPPFPTRGRVSIDDRHAVSGNYWRFIQDMWHSLGCSMPSGSDVVIRIGARKLSPEQLVEHLKASSKTSPKRVTFVDSEVSELRNRQTDHFRPGSKGCLVEVDCHFRIGV